MNPAFRVEIYRGRKQFRQVWRWRVRAGNNRVVATSGEAFTNKADAIGIAQLLFGTVAIPICDKSGDAA